MATRPRSGIALSAFVRGAGPGKSIRGYRDKEVIYSQEHPADAIFYIHKGKVKLTVVSTQGKEAVVAILGVGDFFGEGCLEGQPLRMGSAASISSCSIMRLEKSLVIAALAAEGETMVNRIYHLDRGFERLEEKLSGCGASIERISD